MTPTIKTLPLSQLRPGHEHPDGNLDSRVAGRDADVKLLAASIAAEGLLQSLGVTPGINTADVFEGNHYVFAGNRRLAALQLLAEQGALDANAPIPVIVTTDITTNDGLRKSLIENMDRLPLHPVDRYETFAKVHAGGDSVEDIAARYAITVRSVKQSLALGALSTKVRQEWRDNKISSAIAKALTLAKHDEQDKLLESLKKRAHAEILAEAGDDNWSVRTLRQIIIKGQENTLENLTFVTQEAYEAAGGEVLGDLFGDDVRVDDVDLLQTMVDQKLQKKIDELLAAGWSWAATPPQLDSNARHYWKRLPNVTLKKATIADKEASGCIVEFKDNGQWDIAVGLVKPGTKGAKSKSKKAAPETGSFRNDGTSQSEESATLPATVNDKLNVALTRAAAEAIKSDTQVALAVLLAGFRNDRHNPVRVSVTGTGAGALRDGDPDAEFGDHEGYAESSFNAQLTSTLTMTADEKLALLVQVAGAALDFLQGNNRKPAIHDKDVAAICAAIPGEALNAAVARQFIAADYFAGVPKSLCLDAIAEAMGKEAVTPLSNRPKGEIAAFAANNVPSTGWLPPILRTVHYQGPGTVNKGPAAKAAVPKPAAKAKAKAAKRKKR